MERIQIDLTQDDDDDRPLIRTSNTQSEPIVIDSDSSDSDVVRSARRPPSRRGFNTTSRTPRDASEAYPNPRETPSNITRAGGFSSSDQHDAGSPTLLTASSPTTLARNSLPNAETDASIPASNPFEVQQAIFARCKTGVYFPNPDQRVRMQRLWRDGTLDKLLTLEEPRRGRKLAESFPISEFSQEESEEVVSLSSADRTGMCDCGVYLLTMTMTACPFWSSSAPRPGASKASTPAFR